ncbi:hypothetical protein B0O99DRAFT_43184 [Bisporella sp. PMI_857]|nr:hypothetical protein B0O99DRAFT_43184 [Bisporella sp. PMI_857]
MASLQHAILMLRKPNLHGIPREIRDDLRQLQDAYSEELDIDGSETSSQGSIKPDNLEDTDFEEGGMGKHDDQTREPRAKSQQGGAEQKYASWITEPNDQERMVNRREGHVRISGGKDHSEAKLEVAFPHQRLRHLDIGCVSEPGNSSSRF